MEIQNLFSTPKPSQTKSQSRLGGLYNPLNQLTLLIKDQQLSKFLLSRIIHVFTYETRFWFWDSHTFFMVNQNIYVHFFLLPNHVMVHVGDWSESGIHLLVIFHPNVKEINLNIHFSPTHQKYGALYQKISNAKTYMNLSCVLNLKLNHKSLNTLLGAQNWEIHYWLE